MSKNLTRKGLALGALIALSSSLFAGAPALAANEVTLAPDSGTSYSMIQGEKFTLKASLGDTISSGAYAKLKFKVDNAGANALSATFKQTGTADVTTAFSNTTKVIKAGNLAATGSIARLELTSSTTTVTHTVDVTAWIDSNDNDLVDDSYSSAKQTVTFVKVSEVTANLQVTAATEADTTVAVTYTLSNVNNEQLPIGVTGVQLLKGDGSTALDGTWTDGVIDGVATTSEVARTWDTDNSYFKGTSGTLTALVKGAVLKAQIVYETGNANAATVATAVKLGDAVFATVAARKVALFTATTVRSATAATSFAASGTPLATTADVKRNSTFELQVTATDADGAAVASLPVSIAITTDATLSATAGSVVSVAAAGTTYTDTTKLPGYESGATKIAKISATTDAKGVAKVSITTAGFAAGQYVMATFTAENFTATAKGTARDASYSAFIVEDTADNATGGSYNLTIAEGGTISATVRVVDQFGGAPADDYDAQLVHDTAAVARGTTAVTAGTGAFKAIVGGVGTVSLADNGKGTGEDYYYVYAAKRQAGGGYSTSITVDRIKVNVKTAALQTPGAVTVGASSSATAVAKNTAGVYIYTGAGSVTAPTTFALARNDDFGTYDARFVLGTDPGTTNSKAFGGTVTTAAGSVIAGAKLTIKAPGLLIQAQGTNKVSAVGELTVITDSNGAYSVTVASNKAGKQTIQLVSGSVTQNLEITFQATTAGYGSALAITAPANVLPGQTLKITGTLTDKYGNPVAVATDNVNNSTADFVVSYDGPGLVVGTLPTSTDADGKFTVSVLLGSLDTGSATLTAKYDRNGDNDYADATGLTPDVVKSATVIIGQVAVASAKANVVAKTKAFSVSVSGNASAKNVVVKVAGKTVATLKGSASAKTYTVKATKGSKKVTVYVGGKLIATKTVSVK
jgi:hypothetical protein